MKRFYKGLIACLIATVAFSPIGGAFAENNDYANHWAAERINSWKEKGLITGYEDGSIKPDNQITRAEFITLVNNALATTVTEEVYTEQPAAEEENDDAVNTDEVEAISEADENESVETEATEVVEEQEEVEATEQMEEEVNQEADEPSEEAVEETESTPVAETLDFTDVKETDWFFNEIKKAKAAGYINGYEDQTMRPNNPISRQEATIILANLLGLDTENNLAGIDKFVDKASIPAWSKGAIGAVAAAGYMNGYPDGSFMPTKPITRAETLVILNHLLNEETMEEDKTAPVIKGISHEGVYEEAVTPSSDDQDIDTVELTKDGEAVENYNIGTEISENGEYVLTVVDKAGNTTAISFTINITETPAEENPEAIEEENSEETTEADVEENTETNTEDDVENNPEATPEVPDAE